MIQNEHGVTSLGSLPGLIFSVVASIVCLLILAPLAVRAEAGLDEDPFDRPGFYLGRAYMSDTFLLNFTLYREDIAARETDEFVRSGRISEDCWPGEQQQAATTVK